jgi:osmotically-inducible protein OsmY
MSNYERRSRHSNRPQDEEYNYDDDYQTNRSLSGVGNRGYAGNMDDDWQMSNPEDMRSSGYRSRSQYGGQSDMSDYEQGSRRSRFMGRRSRGDYGYEGGDYGYGYEGGESMQSGQYGAGRRGRQMGMGYGYEGDIESGQYGMNRRRGQTGYRRGGRGESGFSDYEGRYSGSSSGMGYEGGYDTSYGGQGQYGSGYRGYEEGQRYGGQMGTYSGGASRGGRYSGVGPEGYQRSDERIQEEVNEYLMWHGDIDASKMRVKVEKGEVTLEGTVSDRWQKQMASDAAHEVRGVKDVHNRLRIQQENQGTESRQNEGQQGREYTDSSATKQQGDRERQMSSSNKS